MPARARRTATTTAKATTTATTAPRKERPRRGQTLAPGQPSVGMAAFGFTLARNPIRQKRDAFLEVMDTLMKARDRWHQAQATYRTTSPMSEEFFEVMQELKGATESYLDHCQKALRVSEKV